MIVRVYVEGQTADNDGCRPYVLPSLIHHQVGTYKRDEQRSSRENRYRMEKYTEKNWCCGVA